MDGAAHLSCRRRREAIKEEESTGFSCAPQEFDSEEPQKLSEQFRREKEKMLPAA
jgi:hypothetical protein